MSRNEVEQWARQGESESLEFKTTTGERREGAQTLCAMLNHRGGRVIYGIRPDGTVAGQDVSDKTLEDVAQEIKLIDPPTFPTVERLPVGGGKEVVVVTTARGQNGPYSYKGQAYKRVGCTSPAMSRDEYNQALLERVHGDSRWENRIADGWTIADLDRTEIIRTVDEAVRRGRLSEPDTRDVGVLLKAMGLSKPEGLLRAAVVLFGDADRIEERLPQCMLRVARFRGRDKTAFLDNRQFYGNTFRLLGLAERFLRENLPIAGRVVPSLFEREDDPIYPPVALREALANALCHRDYSIGGGSVAIGVYDDRLEITSSGTLHFGLNVEQLYRPHESLPWNPLIARVFYRRGIIESWGRGTIKIMELAERAGLQQPAIEDVGGCVTVRFWPRTRVSRIDLTTSQQAVLDVLEGTSKIALRDLREQMGVEESAVKADLAALKKLGLVRSTGHGRGAYWSRTEMKE